MVNDRTATQRKEIEKLRAQSAYAAKRVSAGRHGKKYPIQQYAVQKNQKKKKKSKEPGRYSKDR